MGGFVDTWQASGGACQPAQDDLVAVAGGDISDWASSAGKDAYNAFTGTGATYTSTVDKLVMDVLGYGTLPTV